MDHKSLGNLGEDMAAQYLAREKGFSIIERNYRCPIGEMDLVAYQDSILVFVEVKTRRSLSFGSPAESVTPRKQKKYSLLAQYYIKEKRLQNIDCRFDVVEVFMAHDGSCQINHIINAFSF
jgi:putative endonuclease